MRDANMRDRRGGFTLIELLVVVVIIGILAALAIPKFAATKERAYVAAIESDLRTLVIAQEVYFSDQNPATYAPSLAALTGYFTPSSGVNVSFPIANATGWSAVATHVSVPAPYSCAYFWGNAPPVAPALVEGEVRCG